MRGGAGRWLPNANRCKDGIKILCRNIGAHHRMNITWRSRLILSPDCNLHEISQEPSSHDSGPMFAYLTLSDDLKVVIVLGKVI
jgi:hypothetical protein